MEGLDTSNLTTLIGVTMVLYIVAMFAIGFLAQRRVHNVEDYVVAGRRLGFPLATATLLATWFGAGTLLTAAGEVRERGLEAATLDPIGAGVCLLLVGLFFAGPLWRMKLTTLPQLFRVRFNARAEVFASVLMIPPYLGWIAAQFMALAAMLELFFNIPPVVGVVIVAAVGLGYTLAGGMWAVILTDAVQMALIAVGLIIMAWVVLSQLGDGDPAAGWAHVLDKSSAERLTLIPTGSAGEVMGWLSIFCAGALGNIPSQDVMQRVFASRSPQIARAACLSSGALYLTFGCVPILLGLAAPFLLGGDDAKAATLPLLARAFLHPALAVVFILTILSAVLSTIDSAILAPATVLAQNILKHTRAQILGDLTLNRIAVVIITLGALGMAWLGEDAYSLLESGYELGMVSLMAPLALGMTLKRRSSVAILTSMALGTLVWLGHQLAGAESFLGVEAVELPVGLLCMAVSFAAYFAVAPFAPNATATSE